MNASHSHITRVLVVGAGQMGAGITQLFASRGIAVTLTDITEQILNHTLVKIRQSLERMAEEGLMETSGIDAAMDRIRISTQLEEAVQGAGFVVENVSESLPLKQEIFRCLDSLCPPEVVLATNTSVISITEIAKSATRPERILGTHFWNPPELIPLVELVPGERTAPQSVEIAFSFLAALGKHPVRVKQDAPGAVGTRLQHALWREALSIVEQGIADAEGVDEVVKYGFGMRLPALGPLETAELIGLDLTLAIQDYLLKHLESSPTPSPLLVQKVEQGHLGFKSGFGFREWTPEGINQTRANLEAHLFQWHRAQHTP